jgi:hypothetical protein
MLFAMSILASKIKNGIVDNRHYAAIVCAESKDEALGLAYRMASHSYKLSDGYQISVGVGEEKWDAAAVDELTKET